VLKSTSPGIVKRSIRSPWSHLVPLGLFIVLAAGFSWLWYQASARQYRSLVREGELLVEQTALRLIEVGKTAEEVAHHMRTAWRGGGATLVGFGRAAQELVARNNDLLAISWVSPGGQLDYIYPPNPANQSTLGWDVNTDPYVRTFLEIARRSEDVVFTPPLLGTHESACVATYLQLGNEGSDGFVSILFSLDALVGNFGDSVLDKFDYALVCKSVGEDGQTDWFGTNGIGDDSLKDRPLRQVWPFILHPNTWELVLAPKLDRRPVGTSNEEDLFFAAGLFLAAALALLVLREFRSRAALAISEHRYRSVVQDLPDFVCRYRPDGTITFVNEAFAARFDRHAEELLGTKLFALYPAEQWVELRAHIAKLAPGEEVESNRSTTAPGEQPRSWERWHERALSDHEGSVAEVQSIGYDVTEAHEAEERLRHSQERYRTLVEACPDGVLIHREGVIVYANESLARLVGAEGTRELGGTELADLHSPIDQENGAEIMRGDEPARYEDGRIQHRDGHTVEVEVIAKRVVFDGRPAVQAILRDVTERREAEHALRESEGRFRTIFGSISDAVLIHDRKGALREVNARASQLFGLPEEVLKRLDIESLLAEDSPHAIEPLRAAFAAALNTGEPQLFEFEARRGRDERWWAEVSLRAADIGGRERLLAVVRDVTERRQAQEALRAARNRLDHLLSTGPTIIYSRTPGPAPSLTFISRNAEQLVGLTQEVLTSNPGRWWRGAVLEADRPRVDAELAESDKRGDRFTCEYRLTTGHGEEIWIQDDARLLRDNEGQAIEWVGCWRDVTARKHSEQSQRLMLDELDHRVKNTLAMVLALLEQTLIRTTSPEELRAAFRGRVEALAHAHEALAVGQWEEVDLERITCLVLGPHLDLGRISVVGPKQPLDARTASPLALSLHELATNAVKHGALSVAGGHVDLTWEREERGLVVSWQERGGPETKPPTERSSSGGAGLRLVRGLIEHELGGRVLLDFEVEGLLAEIVLPLGDTATRPRLLI
jgi:PAS domain S-box-containing protein